MADTTKKSFPLMLVVLVSFASLIIGALLMFTVSALLLQSPEENAVTNNESFFDADNAHVQATVVDFNDSSVTIKNTRGQTETYPIIENLFVSKPGTQPTSMATSSGQINLLERNSKATVNLMKRDGVYHVVSILYLPSPVIAQ